MALELSIRIHDGVTAIGAEIWDDLVEGQSPFLEYGFLSTLEETGCVGAEKGWVPQIITAYRGDHLVGALPFYIKSHSAGEFVFDWSWGEGAMGAGIAYYPKAVVAVPFTPVTGARLLVRRDPGARRPDRAGISRGTGDGRQIRRALVEAAIGVAERMRLSSIHFNFLVAEDVEIFEELGLSVRLGIQYHWENRDESGKPFEDFDGFLGRFRSKRRANIRRERRELVNEGVEARVLVGDEIGEEEMHRLYGYYLSTVHKFYWGHQYLNEDFFMGVWERLRDRLHVVMAYRDGKPFGGAFNLHKGERLYGRYWGCEEEVPFAHFETCMYRPVQWC
ncbi:MAG: GNAT family N-acetyltransferase, partial [Bradymonadaceae bacterium]